LLLPLLEHLQKQTADQDWKSLHGPTPEVLVRPGVPARRDRLLRFHQGEAGGDQLAGRALSPSQQDGSDALGFTPRHQALCAHDGPSPSRNNLVAVNTQDIHPPPSSVAVFQ
jgi:hypothetical protein